MFKRSERHSFAQELHEPVLCCSRLHYWWMRAVVGRLGRARTNHLRSSSSASMPSAKGMMKSQTASAIDAVPKSAWPHGV